MQDCAVRHPHENGGGIAGKGFFFRLFAARRRQTPGGRAGLGRQTPEIGVDGAQGAALRLRGFAGQNKVLVSTEFCLTL